MSKAQKYCLVIGLLLIALVGLFPPRQYKETGNGGSRNEFSKTPSRGFLLSSKLYFKQFYNPETNMGTGSQTYKIDIIRLGIEWIVLIAMTGVCVLCVDITNKYKK